MRVGDESRVETVLAVALLVARWPRLSGLRWALGTAGGDAVNRRAEWWKGSIVDSY